MQGPTLQSVRAQYSRGFHGSSVQLSRRTPHNRRKKNKAQAPAVPTFNSLKRSLMKKVHPDLFHQLPAVKEKNEDSTQRMNQFLDSCRSEELPRCERLDIPFHYRNGSKIESISLMLAPSGGKCDKMLMKQFGEFFGKLGLAQQFTWDPEYWPCEVKERETDTPPPEEE